MQAIKFSQKIEWNFYLGIVFKLMLKRFLSIQLLLPIIVLGAFVYMLMRSSFQFSYGSYSPAIFFFVYMFVLYPFAIYRNAKSNFESSAALKEPLHYELNEDHYIIKGDSFESKSKWSNIFKIEKMGTCVLLYNTKITAYYIDLNQIETLEQIYLLDMLKHIARNNDIKNNLK